MVLNLVDWYGIIYALHDISDDVIVNFILIASKNKQTFAHLLQNKKCNVRKSN